MPFQVVGLQTREAITPLARGFIGMVFDIASRSTQAIDDAGIDALEVARGRDVLLLHRAEPQELSTRFGVMRDSYEGLQVQRVLVLFVHARFFAMRVPVVRTCDSRREAVVTIWPGQIVAGPGQRWSGCSRRARARRWVRLRRGD